ASGGGFMGCEAATGLGELWLDPTDVALSPGVLSLVLDTETSGFIESFLRQQGITVLTNTAAAHFVGEQGRVRAVVTNTGMTLEADLVTVGVGIAPTQSWPLLLGARLINGVR